MELTRRKFCALGIGAAAGLAVAGGLSPAFAAEDMTMEALKAFTGGAMPAEGGVDIGAPEIAENGNTVPVDVSAAGAASILLLADGNPNPGVATFHFGKLAGSRSAATRIRLAQTQNVIAVAKMEDGSFKMAKRQIKVTIGGCGG